jgi:hypothetical protein
MSCERVDLARREDEFGGKTLVVGGRSAAISPGSPKPSTRALSGCAAPAAVSGAAGTVHAMPEFASLFPEADSVVLGCPPT